MWEEPKTEKNCAVFYGVLAGTIKRNEPGMQENCESLDLILLHMFLSNHHIAGQNHSIRIANKSKENS
jgi:hypothetical protein